MLCNYLRRCLALVIFAAAPIDAQEPVVDRPKVGLALSGVSARGFAHIGVLKVLEEVGMPVDYITGTSMGSIVGSLYAIGYPVEELDNIARQVDWDDLFRDNVGRRYMSMEDKRWDARYQASLFLDRGRIRLPSGLVAGQKVSELLARLTWSVHHVSNFDELPIPFACVATDIATGEPVVLRKGSLPEAVRASMAIPTLFTPVIINDRLLVDGLIARNLPAQEVRKMGAHVVIGVDVGSDLWPVEDLESMVDILTSP